MTWNEFCEAMEAFQKSGTYVEVWNCGMARKIQGVPDVKWFHETKGVVFFMESPYPGCKILGLLYAYDLSNPNLEFCACGGEYERHLIRTLSREEREE